MPRVDHALARALALGWLACSCSSMYPGLAPLEPSVRTFLGIPAVHEPTEVNTLRPDLRWSTFDLEAARREDPWYSAVEEVRYDLRVWKAGQPGIVVYERARLESCEHRIEIDLEPGTVYRWSVRPRFARAGETRLGEWSSIVGWWRRNPFNAHQGFLIETPEH